MLIPRFQNPLPAHVRSMNSFVPCGSSKPSLSIMLKLSQLELGPSSLTEVRRTSSLLRTSWRVRSVVLELDELLSYTKRCLNGWSGYVLLKLKSNKSSSNYFEEKIRHLCARVPCSCFLEGLYRAVDTIVLTMHSYSFCNNDCP